MSNKGLQLTNQNLPSPTGQAYVRSLNDGATNGASQPNVPACKFVCLCVCLVVRLFIMYVLLVVLYKNCNGLSLKTWGLITKKS